MTHDRREVMTIAHMIIWVKWTNQRLSRACIVHLVIKRTNWSYVKTMSCSGRHLGIPINIKNTKFVKTFQWLMHSLGSISAIASEKKIFLYFPIWSCVNTMTCGGSHVGFRIGIKRTFKWLFLGSLVSIVQVVYEKKRFETFFP
jgi:hypothetical protein